MAITYHAGRRIQATQADFDGTPAVSGGWKELGRTTLGSAGDDITVSSLDDKRYYMMLFSSNNSTGRTGHNWRFNGDTGTNYAYRRGRDGSEAASGSKTSITWGESVSAGWDNDFSVNYVSNLSSKEKLALGHCVHSQSTGAGTTPNRTEAVGKWANTSDAINSITAHNPEAGSFGSGDEVVVLEFSPDDSHTTNFWEELASVDLSGGESDEISSGTITAKKYLWVQYYREASGVIGGTMQFNDDTGSNYAVRYSNAGGGDSAYGSQSNIELRYQTTDTFGNMFIINNSANEKLVIMHEMYAGASGAGVIPNRTERVGKWANTSDQITKIDINNDQAGNFGTKTMMKVWGSN